MATLSELLDVIIEVQGHEHSNANLIARHVREDDLISSGGRGLGAAQMTDKDAAILLIALAVASPAVRAAKLTRAYRAFQARDWGPFGPEELPPVLGTLGGALTTLVGMYRSGSVPDTFPELPMDDVLKDALSEDRLRTRVLFQRTYPTATLQLWTGDPGWSEEMEKSPEHQALQFIFRPKEGWTNEIVTRQSGRRFQVIRYASTNPPDFGIATSFTDRTLQAVAKVLAQ